MTVLKGSNLAVPRLAVYFRGKYVPVTHHKEPGIDTGKP
jgi:hypothetical protein